MTWLRLRTILIHLAGGLCGFISFFGIHPLSVAYMSAVIMETPFRVSVAIAIILGMFFSAGIITVIKYVLIIVGILFLTNMLERKWKISGRWAVSLLTATTVFVVNFVGNGVAATAFAEGVLVLSLSVILTYLPYNKNVRTFVVNTDKECDVPGKVRLCESAEVFSKLAQCFSELPVEKTTFTQDDYERMSSNVYGDFCYKCGKSDDCWRRNRLDTAATCKNLLKELEQGRTLTTSMIRGRLSSQCIKLNGFIGAVSEVYEQGRIHLFWYNRLIEHREAVAYQLDEMANMIAVVAEEVYDNDNLDEDVEEDLKYALKDIHLKMDKINVTVRKDGREEYFITGHASNAKYVSSKEMAAVLTRILNKKMTIAKDAKTFVTDNPTIVSFVEEPRYNAVCKVARVIKAGQAISGDNYMYMETQCGQAVACISDGMGSGAFANRESETVVELMENFMEAGFSKETAVKMINSTMVLTDGEPSCSTVDICAVDLYEGNCEFIKLGAAPSFIKQGDLIETITSETVPMGVLKNQQYDNNQYEVSDGDFIIMVSDGVIEALGDTENLIYLIKRQETVNSSEIANNILAAGLSACGYNPVDDMTVMVIGIWEK